MKSLSGSLLVLFLFGCSLILVQSSPVTTLSPSIEYTDSNGISQSDIVFDEPTNGMESAVANENDTGKSTEAPDSDSTTELPLSSFSDEPQTTTSPCSNNDSSSDCSIADPSDNVIDLSGQSDEPYLKSSSTEDEDKSEVTTLPPPSDSESEKSE